MDLALIDDSPNPLYVSDSCSLSLSIVGATLQSTPIIDSGIVHFDKKVMDKTEQAASKL